MLGMQLAHPAAGKLGREDAPGTEELNDVRAQFTQALSAKAAIKEHVLGMKRSRHPSGRVADMVNDYAVGQGYGYKTANLVELKMLTEAFNTYKRTPLLAVPEFKGIASAQIKKVLRDVGFDCAARWAEVVAKLASDTMTTKTFSPAFLAARETFSTEFQAAWQRVVGAYAAQEATRLNTFFATDGLDELVASVTAAGSRFMVRSTGKEDTAELANAGGNESIANVAPDVPALLEAIGSVVLSYFGLKSLTQRLSLGDETVKLPEVFTPVLLQTMVGEGAHDAQPPRCGVMFTQEAEGAIQQDGATYNTTGITLIQAAYGHNEGVVNSIIPVDTYYVMDKPDSDEVSVYPVVRNKIDRLVPQPGGMVRIVNSKQLAKTSALTRAEIMTLKEFAWALEAYYDCAMDVEFVVKDGRVFIVQARPIVHKPRDLEPSYVVNTETLTSVKGSTIGAAGGAVRIITQSAQILVAPTIGSALDAYLKSSFNRAAVQAIVVGAMAPSTSHEATTFRNEGKPVLYIPDYERLKPMLDEGITLLVSPQQNAVFQAPVIAGDAASVGGGMSESKGGEADDDAMVSPLSGLPIRQGWISYPVPRALSLNLQLMGCAVNVKRGQAKKTRMQAERAEASELLHAMKTGSQSQVKSACARYMAQLAEKLADPTAAGTFKTELQTVFDAAVSLCKDIVTVATIEPAAPDYTARLLPIRMLEALTYQHLDAQDVMQALSFGPLRKALKQEKTIARDLVGAGGGVAAGAATAEVVRFGSDLARDYYVQLKKMEKIMYAPAVKTQWAALIKFLAEEVSADGIKQLAQLVADLNTFNLLPLWLHTSFMDIGQALQQPTPAACKAAIVQQCSAWQQALGTDFLKQLAAKQKLIAQTTLGAFDDPGRYKAAHAAFKRDLFLFFVSAEFQAGFRAASKLERCAATQVMSAFTQLFDLIIKEVEGNQAWPLENKLREFKTMLIDYNALLMAWYALLPAGAIRFGSSLAPDYFAGIDSVLNRAAEFTAADLRPTPGFNVSAWTLGSATHLGLTPGTAVLRVGRPMTGEDVFTTIHQNILVVIGALTREAGATDMQRPELLQVVEGMLHRIASAPSVRQGRDITIPPFTMVRAEVDDQSISMSYNSPLRNHSLQIALRYEPVTKRAVEHVALTLQFYGRASARWKDIAALSMLLDALQVASIDSLELLATGVTVTLNITEQANVATVQEALVDMICLTFEPRSWEGLCEWAALRPLGAAYEQAIKALQKKIGAERVDAVGYKGFVFLFNQRTSRAELDDNFITDTLFLLHRGLELRPDFFRHLRALVEKGQGFAVALAATQAGIASTDYDVRRFALGLFKVLVEKGQGFAEALAAAQARIASTVFGAPQAALALFKALVEKGQGFAEALAAAQAWIASTDFNASSAVLDLLKALVEKGQGYAEAIAAAQAGIASTESYVRRCALDLFKALVEKGQGYAEAIAAAQPEIASTDSNMRFLARNLFKALFEKGQGYAEAIAAAQAGIASPDYSVRSGAIGLFEALFEKGQGYAEVLAAAQAEIASPDNAVRRFALDLFKALVEKGQGYAEALAAAQSEIASPHNVVRSGAIGLFRALVEKGQYFTEALAAAQAEIASTDFGVRGLVRDLFKALVEKGQGVAEALAAAQEVIASRDPVVNALGIDLFEALFEKGQGYAEALAAAQAGIASPDCSVRSGAIRLFRALVEKGQGYAEALAAAQAEIASPDNAVRFLALALFKALFEKGQGYAEAIAAAQAGIASPDYSVRSGAIRLFKALVENGQGFTEAEAAVQPQDGDAPYVRMAKEDLRVALLAAGRAGGVAV
jgi:hypothetical protein